MVGNIPNFTKIDALRCFLRFNKNIGRQDLAKDLELGEGTVRTILEILKAKKLLDSTKRGHFLSKKGAETDALMKKYADAADELGKILHDEHWLELILERL